MAEQKKKKINYSSAWVEAKQLMWKTRWRFLLGALLMIPSQLSGLVLPASSQYLIDNVFPNKRFDLLYWFALAIGISSIIGALSTFALSQILGVAAQRAITDMRKRVQAKIERLPVSYFDSTQTGQLISRIMSDAEGVRNLVGTGLVQLLSSIITATIAIVVLFYLNWLMTLMTLLVLAAFGGALSFAFNRLRPIFRVRNQIQAEVQGRLVESLGGIRIVKAYTAEKREELIFTRGAHRLFRNVAASVSGVSGISAFSSVIVGAIGVVMIIFGGNAMMAANGMSTGQFIQYVFFTTLLAVPIFNLTNIGTQITEAFAGLDRIREIFEMTTEDEEDAAKLALPDVRGEIEFDNVEFEYEAQVAVLKGVSFLAPAGTTTALVGSSGSGKSTILNLVLNFIQPNSGTVKIDGADLQTVKLRDYRRFLGVVLQDNFLFDGTILENIRFSKPDANLEEVKEVCRLANADEFIEKFPEDYSTIVGERGVKLSGGQRQRIAIARALLANPKILILDEATSSLDSESEAMIQEGLRHLRRGRTTFVIAHRLSTIRSADQILVVEAGEIVERGTHEQLLSQSGRYRQLYDKQYNFEKNLFINPGEDFTTNGSSSAATAKPARTSSS